MAEANGIETGSSVRLEPVKEVWLAIETIGRRRIPALDLPAFVNKEQILPYLQTNHAIHHRQIEYSLYTLDEVRKSPYFGMLIKKFRSPR